MKKIINLGKVDYNNTGRKINAVDIEMELKENKIGQPVFRACGNVWNNTHSDILAGGQMLDKIKAMFPNNKTVSSIHRLWTLYHLNDMKAGVESQENAVKQWENDGHKYDYTSACEYLKSIGLYEVNGYKYGTSWIYSPIPENDLQEIKSLLDN